MSLLRIAALIRRYYYLYRTSWPRVLELVYWPVMNLLLWGFITMYLGRLSPVLPRVIPIFLGALILWDVLFRSQIGVTMAFLEEVWSRNLASLFVSPLSVLEFVLGQVSVGLLRSLISTVVIAVLAALLYAFDVFDMGLPLLAFFGNLLVMGAAVGMFVCGLVLRFGQGAEGLAWAVIFAFMPISAVYYPVDVLPGWLQWIALATPSANVFEGMRAVLLEGRFDMALFLRAVGLNAAYLVIGAGYFFWMFRSARERGLILQMGE